MLPVLNRNSPSGLSWPNGKVAGCLNKRGYWVVQVDGRQQRAHRIVYALTYGISMGELDGVEVDHKDRVKGNNDPTNLRTATRSQNARNVDARGNSGLKGCYVTRYGTFRCNVDGIHFGTFKTIFEAACVLRRMQAIRHEEFAAI